MNISQIFFRFTAAEILFWGQISWSFSMSSEIDVTFKKSRVFLSGNTKYGIQNLSPKIAKSDKPPYTVPFTVP